MNLLTKSLIDGFNNDMSTALRCAFLCERANQNGLYKRALSYYGNAWEYYGRAMAVYSRIGSHDRKLLQVNYKHVSDENFLAVMERNCTAINGGFVGDK